MRTRRPTTYSRVLIVVVCALAVCAAISSDSSPTRAVSASPNPPRDYPVQPVPFTSVHLDDVFWAPRIETNRTETIPFAFKQCELTGRVGNFIRAAKALRREPLTDRSAPGYPFDDTDLYKIIEGASYTLSVRPDPKLDAYVDSLIAKIAAAQEPDGYLYTTRTINPEHPHPWAGRERWVFERDDSHELYDLGHLFEAAAAHYQATGKRTLLDVALRAADLLDRTFGPGKRSIWPGHQITEMGLVRLYRITGEERYLRLARFLLDERGPTPGEKTNGLGLEYNQAHERVIDQTEPVGHAVRATYMYSGMADVAALTADPSYIHAIDTIWQNTVAKKLYITGGIGASGRGEAFGGPYELPNMTAYNETCASVGMDYWNHRLFLLHGDAKYIDVMERTLYNGLISGVSLDGKTFFYPNPLESNGQHERSPWFGVACCPGNITRFLASVPGYVYAHQGDTIFVNLYAAGTGEIATATGRKVRLEQQTRYPWDGAVRITVTPDAARAFAIKLRIPGWARNEPVPSDLYRFVDESTDPVLVDVESPAGEAGTVPKIGDSPRGSAETAPKSGDSPRGSTESGTKSGDSARASRGTPRAVPAGSSCGGCPRLVSTGAPLAIENGYVTISREWRAGDVIALTLPMPVRRIVASDQVAADRGRVALQRGPLVYAAEWPDNAGHSVRNIVLPDASRLASRFRPDLLNGVEVITGRARGLAYDEQGGITSREQDFTAIPYAMWANRGRGQMIVWLARTDEAARPTPWPTPASTATVTTSPSRRKPYGINDGDNPRSSSDDAAYFDWWPRRGTTEWIEYAFARPATISRADVYWFDDTGRGQVRVPASWRVLYKRGDSWVPVETSDAYGVERDRYNTISFTPVRTSGIRLEVTMQPEWSAGVQEWKVR
jgi:DUF1680 family protein